MTNFKKYRHRESGEIVRISYRGYCAYDGNYSLYMIEPRRVWKKGFFYISHQGRIDYQELNKFYKPINLRLK